MELTPDCQPRPPASVQEFYGSSVNFLPVIIKPSRLFLYRGKGMAWVCHNVVRYPWNGDWDYAPLNHTLIHELGHVWQHQSGQLQLIRGLIEQLMRVLSLGYYDPYDYGGSENLKSIQQLTELTTESQAQVLEEYWKATHGWSCDRLGRPFTYDYVLEMERLVGGIRKPGFPRPSHHSILWRLDCWLAHVLNRSTDCIDRMLRHMGCDSSTLE
ncbi:MAG: hypothetical protein KGQ16_04060 [Cyanobacteria bacterium REEB444]|nr:hypothetical protein [Cyanobacteria bacterium REEB444]